MLCPNFGVIEHASLKYIKKNYRTNKLNKYNNVLVNNSTYFLTNYCLGDYAKRDQICIEMRFPTISFMYFILVYQYFLNFPCIVFDKGFFNKTMSSGIKSGMPGCQTGLSGNICLTIAVN